MKRVFPTALASAGLIAAGLIQACASNVPTLPLAAPSAEPAVSFAWNDCVNANAPWVQVDAWRDGTIRYVGSEKVKTRGQRIAKVGVTDVDQLITAAKRFIAMRGRKPLDTVDAPKRSLPSKLTTHSCLQLTADYDGSRQRAVASFESRHVEAFNAVAGRVTPLRELACPRPMASPLWSGNACAFLIMNLHYSESQSCDVMHAVYFYASGDVQHSWSYLVPRYRDSSVDFEEIVRVSPAALDTLLATARSFEITRDDRTSDPGAAPYYVRAAPDELARFVDLLTSTTPVHWQPQVDPQSPLCVKDESRPKVRELHVDEEEEPPKGDAPR